MPLPASIYIIESAISDETIFLTPSRTKPTFVPVLGEKASGVEASRWQVMPVGSDSDLYTINLAGQDLVAKDDELFVTSVTAEGPTQFSITVAGNGMFHVNMPNKDLVWTLPEPGAQVQMSPENGSPNQMLKFVELPRG